MPKRKARSDASVGSVLKSTHKRLRLSDRYEVIIRDRRNNKRQVRSDASIGGLRRKGSKRA